MKKKLLICLIGCILIFTLVGCGEQTAVNINIENSNELNDTVIGKDALLKIGNGLWYDSTTRIVYWWNEELGEDWGNATRYDTTPSPYYAPNGLPYKYNPDTNTLEEILQE